MEAIIFMGSINNLLHSPILCPSTKPDCFYIITEAYIAMTTILTTLHDCTAQFGRGNREMCRQSCMLLTMRSASSDQRCDVSFKNDLQGGSRKGNQALCLFVLTRNMNFFFGDELSEMC